MSWPGVVWLVAKYSKSLAVSLAIIKKSLLNLAQMVDVSILCTCNSNRNFTIGSEECENKNQEPGLSVWGGRGSEIIIVAAIIATKSGAAHYF